MQDFPHRYHTAASSASEGSISLAARGLPTLRVESPPEFGGPDDSWSPETMLVGAVATCFILTFKAVARASKLPWLDLRCEASGTLDRVDRVTSFSGFDLHAELRVPVGVSEEIARRALDKAEHACLVSNSLRAPIRLHANVVTAGMEVEELQMSA